MAGEGYMKIFYKFGIVLLVNLFYFLSANAFDFEVDGIAYNIISDNEVEVTYKSGINYYDGSIVIPEKVNYQNSEYIVTKIGDNAFFWCQELTEVTLPNSLTSIGEKSFVLCESLLKIDLPNSITTIGDAAFYACEALTEVTLSNSLITLGEQSFWACESLLKIDLPNSLTSIGYGAFFSTGLINIKIPENVSFLGDMIFQYCFDLESIEVDSNNQWYTSIDGILYDKEVSLLIWCPSALIQKDLTLPQSLIKIGNSAFSYNTVKNINIPNSVKEIGDLAFFHSDIETIDIPASVREIGFGAFSNCKSLNSISVDSQNPNFTSLDDILYDKDYTLLISCPANKTEIILPVSVIKIGDYAFSGCQLLSNVILSDSLQTIGEGAFMYCSFSALQIPESVTEIGEFAFGYCTYLKNIVIPDGVKTIETGTFDNCYSLEKIVLGKSVNLIEEQAFAFCYLINEMTCRSIEPPVCEFWFPDFDMANCVLYVPGESIGKYQTTYPWSQFGKINGINESGIESILNNDKTSILKVFELNGRKILETNNKSEIKNLPKGIYIIVSGKERYKISI